MTKIILRTIFGAYISIDKPIQALIPWNIIISNNLRPIHIDVLAKIR